MRILFLTHDLPYPLISGPRIRAYYLLRQLAGHHEITLVSLARPDLNSEAVEHLNQLCHAVHVVRRRPGVQGPSRGLFSSPLPPLHQPDMARLVFALSRTQRWDAIHSDGLETAAYALAVSEQVQPRPLLVLDYPHVAHVIARRQATTVYQPWHRLRMEFIWRRLAAYEAAICSAFDRVLTVTTEDGRTLQRLEEQSRDGKPGGRPDRYCVVPVGIDCQATNPVERDEQTRLLLHIGPLSWQPNAEDVLWFGQRVFPYVRLAVPSARFTVVGERPTASVRALRQRFSGRVTVTGGVSDPLPYVRQSALIVVPAQSNTGVRTKILIAWAWGLPVVATRAAVTGLDVRPGENILLANDPSSFTSAIVQILANPHLARTLSAAGRRWVQSRYDWRRTYANLDEIYHAETSVTADEPRLQVATHVALA